MNRRQLQLTVAVLAVLVVSVFGYSLGKDMALRDNARDRAAAQAGAVGS